MALSLLEFYLDAKMECDLYVELDCTDGIIKVPLSLATTSAYILDMLISIGLDLYLEAPAPLPVKLTRKHIHYYTLDITHKHLPKNLVDIRRYNRTLQAAYQTLEDQIIVWKAYYILKSTYQHEWMERIMQNDFYFKKDIYPKDIKAYIESRGRELSFQDFKLTLLDFKLRRTNLKSYILRSIRKKKAPISHKTI